MNNHVENFESELAQNLTKHRNDAAADGQRCDNPVIRMSYISKCYRGQTALDKVSFDVPPGGVFALLGENGAGKTTAIKILLGLLKPDLGQSSVLGLDSMLSSRHIRRRVGYVPEVPTLYDWMTVTEIGWFASGFYSDDFLPNYFKLTGDFGLDCRKKIKELSKGMRAKVALSLAMAHNPELLVLDEPTSGLDAMVRREFLESMVQRAAEGQTVFLSSHQIHEVERVADHVAIIRHGVLTLVEPLESLKATARDLVVTLAEGHGPGALAFPGELIKVETDGRQVRAIVRHVSQADVETFRQSDVVGNIEVRTPNLEDIFVAYMTTDGQTMQCDEAVEATNDVINDESLGHEAFDAKNDITANDIDASEGKEA